MQRITEQIRQIAANLLAEKKVDMVIGYTQGSDAFKTTPYFITTSEEAAQLIWSPFCVNNFSRFLVDYKNDPVYQKIGVVMKACDSRGVIRLVQDFQIKRENIFVIGVPCTGLLDENKVAGQISPETPALEFSWEKGNYSFSNGQIKAEFSSEYLLDKCTRCYQHNPSHCDVVVEGSVADDKELDFSAVEAIEALPPEERSAFWDDQFAKCIRCYACRNACPVCYCRECAFDKAEPEWAGKATREVENANYILGRTFHVAGRCVDCGECSRVCPVGIPWWLLHNKVHKDMRDLYETEIPGINPEQGPVLGTFRVDDPDEFA